MASEWGITPKQSIEAECNRRGRASLIAGCVDLLEGRLVDDDLLFALAGPPALTVLDGGAGGRHGYWPRVWAARGLLHAWDDSATRAIVQGASDDSWRVREMVAKVVAAHGVDRAVPVVATLLNDPVLRVRRAAERALWKLSS
jgi:hypothetical protein